MNKIWILGLLAALAGCAPKAGEKPTLAEDKMAKIMADLAVAEAATMNLSGPAKDSTFQVLCSQAFTLNSVSQEEYEQNLRLYAQNLDAIERITRQSEITLGGGKQTGK